MSASYECQGSATGMPCKPLYSERSLQWYGYTHTASRGPQVELTAASANSQPRLQGVPLELPDRVELDKDHCKTKLCNVPDPHCVWHVVILGGHEPAVRTEENSANSQLGVGLLVRLHSVD